MPESHSGGILSLMRRALFFRIQSYSYMCLYKSGGLEFGTVALKLEQASESQ